MRQTIRTFVLSAALAASLPAADLGDLPVYELKDIIVRGDLWELELQNTPASVSVLDEIRLKGNGAARFEDVINTIPNFTWTGGTSRPRYLQIRGIGENSQFEGETPDSAVRFLVDDFDLTSIGVGGSLFDLQQVEALRGPQAGAFGANAAGGLVQIVSNEPTAYWTGQAEATVGNDDLFAAGLAFGGPILERDPEQLTFRFSINSLNQNGFRDNQFLGKDDANERDEWTSRLKALWKPNQNWQLEGALLRAEANNGYDEFTLNNEDEDTYSDKPGRDEQETLGGSLRATYSGFDAFAITYIGQITDTESLYSYDADWGAGRMAAPPFTSGYTGFLQINRERDVLSQELRLDSKDKENALGWIDRWTVGAYYQAFEEHAVTTGFSDFETNYESETVSFYGQATRLISDHTRVTLGLRAEYYDLETEIAPRPDVNFDDWLSGGKLTLEHDINDGQTTFASVTRGYKAGGANIFPLLNVATLPRAYDTEDLWNYEIGLRSEWFDGKLISQVTLFYLSREDAQLRDSAGTGIDFTYFTVNGAEAEHYGLEAEATWFFAEDWSIHLAGGLLETNRDSYPDPGNPLSRIEKRDLANAPGYNYSARVDYAPRQGVFASAEVVGSDDYFESNSHSEKRKAYAVVNASVGYRWERWTLTLWSKNLFDEEYEERVFLFDNGYGVRRYEAPAAPRAYGVTANYKW